MKKQTAWQRCGGYHGQADVASAEFTTLLQPAAGQDYTRFCHNQPAGLSLGSAFHKKGLPGSY